MVSLGVGMAWIINFPEKSFTLRGLSSKSQAEPSFVKKTPLLKKRIWPSSEFFSKKFSFRLNMFQMTFVEPWRAWVRKKSYCRAKILPLSRTLLSAKENSLPPKFDTFVDFDYTFPNWFAVTDPALSKLINSHWYWFEVSSLLSYSVVLSWSLSGFTC